MDKFLVRQITKWTQDDKQILKSPVSTINTSVVRNTAKRKTPGFMINSTKHEKEETIPILQQTEKRTIPS